MDSLLLLMLAFVALEFCVSSVLSLLNQKWMSHPIPAQVADIYDAESYSRQQDYQRTNVSLARVKRLAECVLTLALLASGAFGWFYGICADLTCNQYLSASYFFAAYVVLSDLIDLPFSYYSIFVIEEKFGFNKSTRGRFVADWIKSLILSLVLTVALSCLILYIYKCVGNSLWLWGTVAFSAIMVFMTLFYSNLIVPLFNKQTPLEKGELRDAIAGAAAKVGFRIKNIYVIDGSKRSTKANAYFTGFGAKKRIVLYDTLIDQLATDEIVAVLMHEIGHYRHHDIIKSLIGSIGQTAIFLYLFSLVLSLPSFSQALGYDAWSYPLSVLAFSLLLTPLDLVLSPVLNAMSRRNERGADSFAATAGYGNSLASALKKLSAQSLSNLTPHPVFVWFNYSHPTVAERVINVTDKISR